MKNELKKNTGFIALHRSIQEHWIWNDAQKLKWWLDILMSVNHKEVKVNIGFELMQCKRGQSLNSLQTWAKRWRVDVSTVRRFLKLLQEDKMIVTDNVKKTTRLTVCNYDTYNKEKQSKQLQDNSETISKQFGDNINNNVLNNDKNVNNEKVHPDNTDNLLEREIQVFKSYQNWISQNAPNVSKMKEQITYKQFLDFTNQFPAPYGEKIFRTYIQAMDNRSGIEKKNISVFKTLINWIRMEKSDDMIKLINQATNLKKLVMVPNAEEENKKKLNALHKEAHCLKENSNVFG